MFKCPCEVLQIDSDICQEIAPQIIIFEANFKHHAKMKFVTIPVADQNIEGSESFR